MVCDQAHAQCRLNFENLSFFGARFHSQCAHDAFDEIFQFYFPRVPLAFLMVHIFFGRSLVGALFCVCNML